MQGRTETIQNIGTVPLASRVKQHVQRWVRNPGRLLQAVPAPALPLENLFQRTDDHVAIIVKFKWIVNEIFILKLLFT